jgi:hypothetical protein
MRDLGAVLDHEKLLPIGMRSIAPAKARRNANFRRSLTSPGRIDRASNPRTCLACHPCGRSDSQFI